jgi:hypothetical protein
MENPDSIEQKFKSSFSDFAQEPPAHVWDNLRSKLHPKPEPGSFWLRITGSSLFPERQMRRYIAFAAAAVILALAVVYFASSDQHEIYGHAYAGEARLCRGIAVLFSVGDKAMPWDTLKHCTSATIDDNGFYKFAGIEPGIYLLRISPEESSEISKEFLPSWFDQHYNPDSSHTIILTAEDVRADVHLMSKTEIGK